MLDRMMTTKYPLGVVLMELAHQMRIRRLVLRAHWLPRLENEEADALTNFDYRHFNAKHRIEVKLEDLKFKVLNELFQEGEDYVAALEKAKAQQKEAKASGAVQVGKKRKKLGDSLRDREPW